MDDSQDPMQIAIETLKERCQQFEQRMIELETENLNLRLKCSQIDDIKNDSVTEIDLLKQRNSLLKEHNTQLKNNVQMVASENRQLWTRLSKLMQVNKTLGNKINKLNDSLMQHGTKLQETPHTALIRSKTFTQNKPYMKHQKNAVDENLRISIELEDISLKLISSMSKEKSELEAQCNEMMEIQSGDEISNSLGFSYPDNDSDESIIEDIEQHIIDLKSIKQLVLEEQQQLQKNIENIRAINVKQTCTKCEESKNSELKLEKTYALVSKVVKEEMEASSQLEALAKWGAMASANTSTPIQKLPVKENEEVNKICPMCTKIFFKQTDFKVFQQHVESHFKNEPDSLSNFEIL